MIQGVTFMKRFISLFIVVITVLAVSFSAHAAGTLSVKNITAKNGDTFSVNVELSGNPGIIATRIIINYDNKYLSLEGVQNGNIFPQSKALFGKDYSSIPYMMIWEDALGSDITANGTLVTLTFKVKAESPSGKTVIDIAVDSSSTFDAMLKEKSISGTECTVSFPTVTTEKKETTTKQTVAPTTEKAVSKPEGTTKNETTKKTKPTSPSITSPTTPEGTKITEEILGTKETTTVKNIVSTTTNSSVTNGKSEASTESDEKQISTVTVDEPKESFEIQANGTLSEMTSEENTVEIEEETFNKNYLWILLIVPIAAAVIIILKKKAGDNDVK